MGVVKNRLKKAVTKLGLMESLEKLKKDLQKLGPAPTGRDIYDYGVNFFNIIASFQDDNAIDIEMFKDTTEEAKDLALHISNAGRQEYGVVRAARGEPVTLYNLYLGNIYGLWTKPAVYWKENPEKIIECWLANFIKSHREPMIELVTKVLKDNKKPDNFIVKKVYEKQQAKKR